MASLGNSVGEGHQGRLGGDEKFVATGYGTYQGQGNVKTGYEEQKGTGYDEHGQVKTSFGHWPVQYDPVTGTIDPAVTESGPVDGATNVAGGRLDQVMPNPTPKDEASGEEK